MQVIFYHKCGTLLVRALIKCLNIVTHGDMLKELNRTNIVDIPKKQNPNNISYYRPVYLIGLDLIY